MNLALAAVLAAAPLHAQTTNQASPPPASPPAQTPTQSAAPTPAPSTAPAPTGDAVGPPQLRDFNLPGTVTQPAQAGTPAAQPATPPAQRAPVPDGDAPSPTRAPVTAQPRPATPAPRAPLGELPDTDRALEAAPTASVPLDAAPLPDAAFSSPPVAVDSAAPATPAQDMAWWPWLAAFLALALGAGFLWWRRHQPGEARYAADDAALGALAASGDAVPQPLPRAAAPSPAPRPAPQRQPAPMPVPSPAPAPAPAPAAAPAPPAPPIADGIVSSRLKPELSFELEPLRAEADGSDGAALTFDLVVANNGSVPARDVLVEAHLINAGPRVDAEVGAFFQKPGGSGERVPLIPPMGRVAIRTRLAVDGAKLTPLVVEGRKLFVPVVAVNAFYPWSGGEQKNSSSFLVGRGAADGGKMAPFRLDQGPRSWSGLAARLHSTGLKR